MVEWIDHGAGLRVARRGAFFVADYRQSSSASSLFLDSGSNR